MRWSATTMAAPSQSLFQRRGVDRPAVDAPQLDRLRSVEGDDPEVVVTRTGVDQWVAVGIDGDRTLRDVAGRERRDDVLAGCRVDEVDPVVVGAEHDPGAAVALEHDRLTGPAGPAPDPRLAVLARLPTHRPSRVLPQRRGRHRHRTGAVEGARRVAAEREQSLHRRPPWLLEPARVGERRRRGAPSSWSWWRWSLWRWSWS